MATSMARASDDVARDPTAGVRRRIAAVGLVLGPSLFTAGELLHHQTEALPLLAAGTSLLGLYLWIAGILGLVHLLRPDADVFGLVGGATALLGIVAVSNIMLVQLVLAILEREVGAYPEAVEQVFRRVLGVSYLFGPTLPAGLFLLACGLLRTRAFPAWITLALLLGALTFPAGRVGGLPWLLHLTDLVLTFGSAALGWELWRRPELWARGKAPVASLPAPPRSSG